MPAGGDGRRAAERARGLLGPLVRVAALAGVNVLLVLALSPPAQADHRPGPDPGLTRSADRAPTVINAVGRTYCAIWLDPRGGGCNYWLRGRVTSAGPADLGTGVAGVKVFAHSGLVHDPGMNQKHRTEVTTDSDGWFTAWLPNGVVSSALVGDIGLYWLAYTPGTTTRGSSITRGVLVPTAGYDVQPPR